MSGIKVKFMGTFRWASRTEQTEIEIPERVNVKRALEILFAQTEELRSIVGENPRLDPRPSMIVLVNEVEIGLLRGLETPLQAGDTLTLIPTAHGG